MVNDDFTDILKHIRDLHNRKSEDYGKDNDPYANVREGAVNWGIEPWIGAMIRASDKVARLQAYARNGVLANEGVEDSLQDIAVYAIIALILFRQEMPHEGSDSSTD